MKNYLLLAIIAFSLFNCDQIPEAKEVIVEFKASLELTVVDEQNKPIEGALVKITTTYEGEIIDYYLSEDLTDTNGSLLFNYHYENLDTRYHSEDPIVYSTLERFNSTDHVVNIIISKTGYKDWTGEENWKNGDKKSVSVTLKTE
jgi:hypothetical protein